MKHEGLFQIVEKLVIVGKDLRIVRNLYWDQLKEKIVNLKTLAKV